MVLRIVLAEFKKGIKDGVPGANPGTTEKPKPEHRGKTKKAAKAKAKSKAKALKRRSPESVAEEPAAEVAAPRRRKSQKGPEKAK